MNTVDDKGATRAAIITEIKELLNSLEEPTTGGEHRVAIAGYGRINMSASTDPYDASIYPGTAATGSGISLNTGYYTANGFLSKNGWTDISQSAMTGAGLPQMPASYKESMTYDNAFLTLDEANTVLNVDSMMAWYAGASRMDAGLTIAEQLASVADANDPNGERNLLVCILSSSLPIQNTVYKNLSTIRTAAVQAATDQLKSLGATIFAFGDYHASGKTMAGDVQDTEDNFDYYMQQICTEPDYFYSFSDFSSVTDALNAMITKVSIIATGEAEKTYTVTVQDITNTDSEDNPTITWKSVLDFYGTNAAYVLNNTMVQISYYKFDHYDSDGNPVFEDIAHNTTQIPLSSLSSVDSDLLTYTTNLVPLPAEGETTADGEEAHYGNKIVITFSAPATVTYQWASDADDYAPDNAVLPNTEIVVPGDSHQAASVTTSDGADFDEHYAFAGWYTDKDCTTPYTSTENLTGSLTLYGKWEKHLHIQYYWNIWETGYDTPDSEIDVSVGTIPDSFTPTKEGYTFDGWYLNYSDETCSDPYTSAPVTEDLKLYANWIPNSDTAYTIYYYQQNPDDDNYTEISEDTQNLTGTTDEYIPEITKTYDGFTLNHITYESNRYEVQSDPLPIQSDGSLVIRVYYNRSTDQGNTPGTDSGDDEDIKFVPSGISLPNLSLYLALVLISSLGLILLGLNRWKNRGR
jgi:uncharacterized repeat protein (TIGR02543 family)